MFRAIVFQQVKDSTPQSLSLNQFCWEVRSQTYYSSEINVSSFTNYFKDFLFAFGFIYDIFCYNFLYIRSACDSFQYVDWCLALALKNSWQVFLQILLHLHSILSLGLKADILDVSSASHVYLCSIFLLTFFVSLFQFDCFYSPMFHFTMIKFSALSNVLWNPYATFSIRYLIFHFLNFHLILSYRFQFSNEFFHNFKYFFPFFAFSGTYQLLLKLFSINSNVWITFWFPSIVCCLL